MHQPAEDSEDSGLGNEIIEAEYEIEKILAKKIVNGKKQYLVKFAYYDDSHNTWIPAKDVDEDAAREFEKQSQDKWNNKMLKSQEKLKRHIEQKEQRKAKVVAKKGFKNPKKPFWGKKADYIFHARKTEQGIVYFIKWKVGGISEIPSSIVREKIPELVIKFYEAVPWDKPEAQNSTAA